MGTFRESFAICRSHLGRGWYVSLVANTPRSTFTSRCSCICIFSCINIYGCLCWVYKDPVGGEEEGQSFSGLKISREKILNFDRITSAWKRHIFKDKDTDTRKAFDTKILRKWMHYIRGQKYRIFRGFEQALLLSIQTCFLLSIIVTEFIFRICLDYISFQIRQIEFILYKSLANSLVGSREALGMLDNFDFSVELWFQLFSAIFIIWIFFRFFFYNFHNWSQGNCHKSRDASCREVI